MILSNYVIDLYNSKIKELIENNTKFEKNIILSVLYPIIFTQDINENIELNKIASEWLYNRILKYHSINTIEGEQ